MAAIPIMQSASGPNEANLLGLPRELRLQIYEYVFALDLGYALLREWKDTHSSRGFVSVPDLTHDKLHIPWLSLMLSCRSIAHELKARMLETSFLENPDHRTYSLNLQATRGGMALGATMLRRIPCPPKQVKYVQAYYNADWGFQAWGNGGPHGITSGLYQTLNHLIHCGPKLDSRYQLPETMHLKELRIPIENSGGPDPDDEDAWHLFEEEVNPETTLYALGSIVGQISRTGVLRGFVDRIFLLHDDKRLEWYPEDSEGNGIPEYWNRYGFDWGMVLYQTESA